MKKCLFLLLILPSLVFAQYNGNGDMEPSHFPGLLEAEIFDHTIIKSGYWEKESDHDEPGAKVVTYRVIGQDGPSIDKVFNEDGTYSVRYYPRSHVHYASILTYFATDGGQIILISHGYGGQSDVVTLKKHGVKVLMSSNSSRPQLVVNIVNDK